MPPIHDAMSEPGDAANTRADSITLTLKETTVDSKSDIPRRTFELSSDNKKIVIGRSSKTISKGLIPAANNGYFDSPVVSREHASIEADLEEGVVRVTDAKSLHGTSVNGNRLEAGVPFTLSNGDKLRFGAHVARALDIFHPTDCQIEIVRHQQEQEAAPVVKRARSYCAPESVDDTSDSDSSDEYDSQTDEPSPKSGDGESLMECDTPTQTGGIKLPTEKSDAVPMFSLTEVLLVDEDGNDDNDDDEVSYEYDSEDGYSVEGDVLGETSNEDEDEEDYEEGEEDYGEEEEEDGEDDADDNGINSELQDLDNGLLLGVDAEDDGGAFLEKEIRQFMDKANEQGKVLDKKLQAFAAKASQEPEVSNNVSASEPIAVPFITHQEEVHDTVMEDVPDANANTHPFTAVKATVTSAGNKKLDIPSILNPSPSSLLSGADQMSLPFVFASGPNTAEAKATSAGTNAYPSQQVFNQLDSYATKEAAVWQMPAVVTQAPVVKATPAPAAVVAPVAVTPVAPVAPVAPVTPVTPKEAVFEPTQAKTAMKRKIDDVAAEDVRILAQTIALPQTPERVMHQAMLTPPAEDGPAPKRQATVPAVAATAQTKSKAWAAVEKIGIAALGGAVVLGSLIYTAPTF